MTEDERVELEIARHTERALFNHKAANALAGESLHECAECGNEIPEERRKALQGVALCIECKRAEELEARSIRGNY